MKQYLKDLLGMGRTANLPSVLSNTLTGTFIALFPGGEWAPSDASLLSILLVTFAVCFLYLGACLLNDWHDTSWDARERPERPIPAGRITRRHVYSMAMLLLLLGLGLATLAGPATGYLAGALLVFIIGYTILHKRSDYAIILMGFCRALLYPLGYFAAINMRSETDISDSIIWGTLTLILPFCALFSYTIAISITARKVRPFHSSNTLSSPKFYLHAPLIFLGVAALTRGHILLFLIAAAMYWLGVHFALSLKESRHDKACLLLASLPLVDLMALTVMPVAWPFLLVPMFGRVIGKELQHFTPAS